MEVDDLRTAGTSFKKPSLAPCDQPLRPDWPPKSERPIAVTFSGGGFRATLPALGVTRLLADIGLLRDVRYVSSVSGGSIANALLSQAWNPITNSGFSPASVDDVIDRAVQKISSRSLTAKLLRNAWRTIGPTTRTDLLARAFDDWFLDEQPLEEIPEGVRWIFSAANLITGTRFGFERDVVGDYVSGLSTTQGTGIRLAEAVAASCAFPGLFAPVHFNKTELPCAIREPILVDGGAYDNTGLEAIDGKAYKDVFIVALNAGGSLVPGKTGKIPFVRDLARSNSLLYRQSHALRTRLVVERFRAWEQTQSAHKPEWARQGILVALGTGFTDGDRKASKKLVDFQNAFEEVRTWTNKEGETQDLAFAATSFSKFSPELATRLVYRGWWLTGAAIARYHPHLLPDDVGVLKPPRFS